MIVLFNQCELFLCILVISEILVHGHLCHVF